MYAWFMPNLLTSSHKLNIIWWLRNVTVFDEHLVETMIRLNFEAFSKLHCGGLGVKICIISLLDWQHWSFSFNCNIKIIKKFWSLLWIFLSSLFSSSMNGSILFASTFKTFQSFFFMASVTSSNFRFANLTFGYEVLPWTFIGNNPKLLRHSDTPSLSYFICEIVVWSPFESLSGLSKAWILILQFAHVFVPGITQTSWRLALPYIFIVTSRRKAILQKNKSLF